MGGDAGASMRHHPHLAIEASVQIVVPVQDARNFAVIPVLVDVEGSIKRGAILQAD
jgi:hypothetical protein